MYLLIIFVVYFGAGFNYVAQAVLKIVILPTLPPECWDYRHDHHAWLLLIILSRKHFAYVFSLFFGLYGKINVLSFSLKLCLLSWHYFNSFIDM
jgi:hypothetical protein